MNTQRRIAWQIIVLWSIVLVIFLALFFYGDEPSEWGMNSTLRFLSAIDIALGYIGFLIIQRRNRKIKKDEREHLIQLKASQASMIIILLYAFIFGITLFTIYENRIYMPVTFMWFLAYTIVFLTYIVNSAMYLWFEKRIDGYGKY